MRPSASCAVCAAGSCGIPAGARADCALPCGKTGVLNLLPFAIRVVSVQPHVNAPLDPGVLMRLQAADGDTELTEIAVRSPDDPHAFDGRQGIGGRGAERLICLLVTRLDAGANEA